MKTNKSLVKTLMAIAIMFASANTAQAQFGNIIDKAKKTVTGTAEHMVDKATEKAQQKARKKMYEIVKKKVLNGKQMPEQPWPMSDKAVKDYTFPPTQANPYSITYYVYNLPNESPENIAKLRDQLTARYKANQKILIAQEAGLFSQLGGYVSAMLNEVEEEQGRWQAFYAELWQRTYILFSNYQKKDINGQGAWEIIWKPTDISCPVDRTTYWIYEKNGKMGFFDINGYGAYATPADVKFIKDEIARMDGIALLTEGLTNEGDDPNGNDKYEMARLHAVAVTWSNAVKKALANNSPENLEKQPMPKAGSLNKSLKAKALSCAKAEDSSIIDVVITSNTWDIKREYGVPKHRVVYGYVIRKTEVGKQASKRSWCQDYMGGGKYGGLRNFGVGTESFYVK
jgi:hypothetical protein